MVVSKKQSAGIRFFAVKREARWKRTTQLTQALYRSLSALVAADLKAPGAHRVNFDLISLLQFQGLGDHCGQPNREAVPPFCNAHFLLLDILRFPYIIALTLYQR